MLRRNAGPYYRLISLGTPHHLSTNVNSIKVVSFLDEVLMTRYVIRPMNKSKLFIIIAKFLTLILLIQVAQASPSTPTRPKNTEVQEITVRINAFETGYAVTRILDPELPTLILLPGIFRGFLPSEEILTVLSRRKLNWIAWHSSRHPESILHGTHNPAIRQVSSQTLAMEISNLKEALKIKKPILVSLSYSASIIPYISSHEFPVVIETAPMGTALENNPPSPYYESWRQWMGMFPIFGNMVVQSQEYWAYRGYWLQQTANLIKTHPRYEEKQSAIAEGLAQLAYAGRGFDLRQQDFAKGPKRFWILGKKENRTRRAIQNQAIKLYEQQTGHENSAYEIEDAGHVIPNENPVEYVKVLSQLVQKLSR